MRPPMSSSAKSRPNIATMAVVGLRETIPTTTPRTAKAVVPIRTPPAILGAGHGVSAHLCDQDPATCRVAEEALRDRAVAELAGARVRGHGDQEEGAEVSDKQNRVAQLRGSAGSLGLGERSDECDEDDSQQAQEHDPRAPERAQLEQLRTDEGGHGVASRTGVEVSSKKTSSRLEASVAIS